MLAREEWHVTQEGLIGCAQTYGLTAQVLARLGRGFSGLASLQLRDRKARLNRSAFPECGLERRAETTNVNNVEQSSLAVIELARSPLTIVPPSMSSFSLGATGVRSELSVTTMLYK